MREHRAAGGADGGDGVALLHALADLHPAAALADMAVEAELAVAVVNDHVVPPHLHPVAGQRLWVELPVVRPFVHDRGDPAVARGAQLAAEPGPALVLRGIAARHLAALVHGHEVVAVAHEVRPEAELLQAGDGVVPPAVMGVEVVAVVDDHPAAQGEDERRHRLVRSRLHDEARGVRRRAALSAELHLVHQPRQADVAVEAVEGIEDEGDARGGEHGHVDGSDARARAVSIQEAPDDQRSAPVVDGHLDLVHVESGVGRVADEEVEIQGAHGRAFLDEHGLGLGRDFDAPPLSKTAASRMKRIISRPSRWLSGAESFC